MKTYKTIKENKAYLEGYDDGAREQAHVFEEIYGNVEDVKENLKYDTSNHRINWCAVALFFVLFGIVCAMIFTDHNYGFINA